MKKLAFFTCIIFVSCQNQQPSESGAPKDSVKNETAIDSINTAEPEPETVFDSIFVTDNYLVANTSVKKDFLFIPESCGIFISIDSIQDALIIKESGQEVADEILSDNNFYTYSAMQFLEKMNIECIFPRARYLKFKVNGDTLCFDTKSRFNTEGITILYKKNTLPKLYGSSDVEQAYNSYFR